MNDEAALIARINAGQKEALVEYIDLKRRQLLAFIQRSMSDQLLRKVEPADILQEVSVSALAGLERIELGEREPFSWLCQLAERRIIDAHRRFFGAQKRSAEKEVRLQPGGGQSGQQGLIDLLVASLTSPSQAFSRGQREMALLQALDELPEESREALRMRYLENLPSKQIAEKLGRTDGATRVLLTRALNRLHGILSENALFQSFGAKRDA